MKEDTLLPSFGVHTKVTFVCVCLCVCEHTRCYQEGRCPSGNTSFVAGSQKSVSGGKREKVFHSLCSIYMAPVEHSDADSKREREMRKK